MMIQIRKEIGKIESGDYDKVDNPLKNAPHCSFELCSDNWEHSYSREVAGFPLPWVRSRGKFWTPVGRIDNVYGDRNLICSCPSVESYQEDN